MFKKINLDYYNNLHLKKQDTKNHVEINQYLMKDDIEAIFSKIESRKEAFGISLIAVDQKFFESIITKYGKKFSVICFTKCPLISNLSALEDIDHLEYVTYYWNQRLESLWDLSKNPNLKGLSFDDFTRLHHLKDIPKSRSLKELYFGDKIWDSLKIDSLTPLQDCFNLESLKFSFKKLEDNDIRPLSKIKNLKKLEFQVNIFKSEQIAWLKAHLPNTIHSNTLQPFSKIKSHSDIIDKNINIHGKRKPLLHEKRDAAKIQKYIEKFNHAYEWYLQNQLANPEEYPRYK